MRIERYQSYLRNGPRRDLGFIFVLADLYPLGTQLVYLRIHFFQTDIHGLRRCRLQRGIERGVNAKAFRIQIIFTILADQLFTNQVNKVRCVTGFNILRSKLERSRLSGISLGLRNGAGFNHGLKNEIAKVKSALWMTVRREIAWSLDQTRQHSRFWERDVFQVLAEVRLRRLTEAGDGE